jgi:HD-GYP domain-containing protein (c-di-GMP phosphodiesterase class II)
MLIFQSPEGKRVVRISDFFGDYGPGKDRDKNKVNPPNKIEISSIVAKEHFVNNRDALKLYEELLSEARNVYAVNLTYEAGLALKLNTLVTKIVDYLNSDNNKELLRLCLVDYPGAYDYLYCHAANTCIISVEIGVGLVYEKGRLIELGTAAFIHDIGIIQYLNIINKQAILTKEEFGKVKQHPKAGVEVLNKMGKEFSLDVRNAVIQEHERMDGSGYPAGLKGGEISEYAQIIGLVDVYEAMLHQRPYRSNYTPLETIKTILNDKGAFNSQTIKVLIERIGIFPIGISVRLNTKEVGVVIKENIRLPLRPVVNITYDAYGKELKQPKQIDLAENSMVCIEDCIKRK